MIALLFGLMAAAGPDSIAEVPAQDIFIGTVAVENGLPVLTRCDLAETRYGLHDATGTSAVAAYTRDGRPSYAEVIGSYAEVDGQPALDVSAIDHLTPGKNCHLRDTLDALITNVPAKNVPALDAKFIGHYYLAGVMETGSELQLRPDGTFDWFLSYGAVDQSAQGTWQRHGQEIVLTSMPATKNKTLFAFLEVEPWGPAAEDEMRRRERDAEAERIRARCPFLTDSWVSTPSIPSSVLASPTRAELQGRAAAALSKAIAARTGVESLARIVMARPASDQPRYADQINDVLTNWIQSRSDANETADAAGLAAPGLGEPVLPDTCNPPGPLAAASTASLTGGLGVRMMDLDSHHGVSGVTATLQFADGHRETLQTAGRGLAIRPGPAPSGAVRIMLHVGFAPEHDATFALPPVTRGIIHFAIDTSQLMAPAFASLRLRIDGAALIPLEFGRGRYERQP